MGKFTDRLWAELADQHGPELTRLGPPRPPRRRRDRPRRLAGTGAGVAAIAAIAAATVLILGAASSPPAFAVTHNHDGTYTIRLRTITAIAAANRALRGLRVHAQIVPVSAGCGAGAAEWQRAQVTPAMVHARLLAAQARVDPRRIPPGKTIVIPAWRVGRVVRVVQFALTGGVPVCVPPPCGLNAPAPAAAGNSGSPSASGNSGTGNSASGNSGSGNSGNSRPSPDRGAPRGSMVIQPDPVHLSLPTLRADTRTLVAKLAAVACRPVRQALPAGANTGNSGSTNAAGSAGNS